MSDEGRRRETDLESVQQPLFDSSGSGRLLGHAGQLPELTSDSRFDLARYWYRRYLEQFERPRNTVNSYCYDLQILEQRIGPKRIRDISARDIGSFLDESTNRSTRKRRLTSVSSFFDFLLGSAQVLDTDPSEGFYPEHIPLKTPRPLLPGDQERMLNAAAEDGPRAYAVIWLLLKAGLTRSEVLNLRASHLDLSDPAQPVIYIYYEKPRHRTKERKLATTAEFIEIMQRLETRYGTREELLPILPQTVNKIVERVALASGIDRPVTPQLLRDTFAVNQATSGLDEAELIQILGLINDARNRASVQRYLRLASPPLQTERGRDQNQN